MGSSEQLKKFNVKILRNNLDQFILVMKYIDDANDSIDRISETYKTEEAEENVTSETYKERMLSDTYKIHN